MFTPKINGRWRRRGRPDVAVLTGVSPFDRYPAGMLAPLAVNADRLKLADGTVVAREGRGAREVVGVVAGTLLAVHARRVVGVLGPGTWVGAAELVEDRPHGVTLVAGEGLEVLVLTSPAFRWAAATLPGLADACALVRQRAPEALEPAPAAYNRSGLIGAAISAGSERQSTPGTST